jgi:hypothetical protein
MGKADRYEVWSWPMAICRQDYSDLGLFSDITTEYPEFQAELPPKKMD